MLTRVPLGSAFIANMSGDALAAVTPGRAGGEPVRFVAFKRAGAPSSRVLSAVGTEYVVDALVLVVGAILLSIFAARHVDFLNNVTAWMRTPHTWMLITIGLGVIAIGFAILHRVRPHYARRVRNAVRDAWRQFKAHSFFVLFMTTLWTVISFGARAAILPVLLASVPGIPFSSMVLGSAAVFYLFMLSPTPAGVGIIELGFIAGLKGTFKPSDLARLIVLWRVYTFVLGGAIGAVFLIRRRMQRRAASRPASG